MWLIRKPPSQLWSWVYTKTASCLGCQVMSILVFVLYIKTVGTRLCKASVWWRDGSGPRGLPFTWCESGNTTLIIVHWASWAPGQPFLSCSCRLVAHKSRPDSRQRCAAFQIQAKFLAVVCNVWSLAGWQIAWKVSNRGGGSCSPLPSAWEKKLSFMDRANGESVDMHIPGGNLHKSSTLLLVAESFKLLKCLLDEH